MVGRRRAETALSGLRSWLVLRSEAPLRTVLSVAPYPHNNLAWLLPVQKNDPASALPLEEKAVGAGGSLPEILDTLGWIHARSDSFPEALDAAKGGLKACESFVLKLYRRFVFPRPDLS